MEKQEANKRKQRKEENTNRGRRAVVTGASIGTILLHREFRDSSMLESVPIDRSVEPNHLPRDLSSRIRPP